jgi:DNA-binding NtrC family response regulator
MSVPVTLFYSYSHRDGDLRDELDGHLKILERRGMVQSWHDRPIDTRDQKRVLWVDERPEGNLIEIAALNKLQIEVLTARSTNEAMARIAADIEGFDLVISDWERDGEPPGAGLALLKRLREEYKSVPVVYYHGGFEPKLRAVRAKKAKEVGALGEAILPTELLGLVVKALSN